MRIVITLFVLAACMFISSGTANAHSDGASFEQEVGGFIIDVGYDPVAPTAGLYERFDFNLVGANDTPVEFAEVWTRIVNTDNSETLLATGVRKQPTGPTTLLYTFAQSGNYSLQVSFRKANGDEIAAASFPLEVGASNADTSVPGWVSSVALGIMVGIIFSYIVARSRRLQ